jgi:PAS domain S-box-containing protein
MCFKEPSNLKKTDREFYHDLINKLARVEGYSSILKTIIGEDNQYILKLDKANHEAIDLIKTQKHASIEDSSENVNSQGSSDFLGLEAALNEHSIVAKTDAQGTITYVNDKFVEISKFERKELIGQNHRIINSGEHTKEFFKEMWSTISSGNPWRGSIKNKAKDGSYYWVDSIIAPLMEDEKIREYISIRFDITKAKRREAINSEISRLRAKYIELMKDREKFFKYFLESILNITDSEYGFISEVRKDAKEVPSLFLYFTNDVFWYEQARELHDLNSFCDKMMTSSEILIVNSKSNDPSIKSFLGVPILLSGEVVALIGLVNRNGGYPEACLPELKPIIDLISEMLNTFKLEDNLEYQTKLSQHNAKLASIGRLAAGVGHEINNPLAIIQGHLSMIESEMKLSNLDNKKIFERLGKVDLAIERIANIVKGLRSFSRTDDQPLSSFDIYQLISETCSMMKDIYIKEGIDFDFFGKNENVFVLGSRGRFQQVLVNLITNAKDATEGRENRKIKINFEIVGNEAKVTVKDNGQGISIDILDKIFDPFFTTKEVNKGTGIGLALASTIMKEHGGRIDVDSKLGNGATFTLTLPIQSGTSEFNLAKPEEKLEGNLLKSNVKINCRVLVADDEEDLRDILEHILKPHGIYVESVANGQLAYEALQKSDFDLVISDIKMPLLDGPKLLDKIRSDQDILQPKFIFITGGMDFDDDKLKNIILNTDGILAKPFHPKLIIEKLTELFPDKVQKK